MKQSTLRYALGIAIALGALISLATAGQPLKAPRPVLRYEVSKSDTTADTIVTGPYSCGGTIYQAADTTHVLFGQIKFSGDTVAYRLQYRGVDPYGAPLGTGTWQAFNWSGDSIAYAPNQYIPISDTLHVTEQFIQLRVIRYHHNPNAGGQTISNAKVQFYFYEFIP